jgi:hypothetical protein
MSAPRNKARARVDPVPRRSHRTASALTGAAEMGEEAPRDAPGSEKSRSEAPERPDGALHGLLRGLRAGDLESVLLTVEMAVDENRMPSADPDEAARILAFLVRLAEYDAV